jgi:hypothetical protein
MATIHSLERKRIQLVKQLKEYDSTDPEFEVLWYELCKVAMQINTETNKKYVNELRKGLPALYQFFSAGFDYERFTVACYRILRNTYGFTACYDKNGFYDIHFSNSERRINTLKHMFDYEMSSVFYKETEQEITDYIYENKILANLKKQRVEETIKSEKATLQRLADKYNGGEIPK